MQVRREDASQYQCAAWYSEDQRVFAAVGLKHGRKLIGRVPAIVEDHFTSCWRGGVRCCALARNSVVEVGARSGTRSSRSPSNQT